MICHSQPGCLTLFEFKPSILSRPNSWGASSATDTISLPCWTRQSSHLILEEKDEGIEEGKSVLL